MKLPRKPRGHRHVKGPTHHAGRINWAAKGPEPATASRARQSEAPPVAPRTTFAPGMGTQRTGLGAPSPLTPSDTPEFLPPR